MDFKQILGTIAPWIGTALGGPLGGMAVEAAANALGLSEKSVDSLKTALSGATPDQMLALKKADQDFAIKMKELGFQQLKEIEALTVEDRKDARAMQSSLRSVVPPTLSIFITGGYFTILIGMMLGKLQANDSQALLIMLGSLGTAFGMVMSFWFGTTAGSSAKTEMLANSVPIKESNKEIQ